MIRRMEARDLEAVASIWLASNLEAHSFIPAEYWRGNYEAVKAALAQAEVYVYEDAAGVLGFVGLSGDYVEPPTHARTASAGSSSTTSKPHTAVWS